MSYTISRARDAVYWLSFVASAGCFFTSTYAGQDLSVTTSHQEISVSKAASIPSSIDRSFHASNVEDAPPIHLSSRAKAAAFSGAQLASWNRAGGVGAATACSPPTDDSVGVSPGGGAVGGDLGPFACFTPCVMATNSACGVCSSGVAAFAGAASAPMEESVQHAGADGERIAGHVFESCRGADSPNYNLLISGSALAFVNSLRYSSPSASLGEIGFFNSFGRNTDAPTTATTLSTDRSLTSPNNVNGFSLKLSVSDALSGKWDFRDHVLNDPTGFDTLEFDALRTDGEAASGSSLVFMLINGASNRMVSPTLQMDSLSSR